MAEPLSDNQAHDRILEALEVLGDEDGQTVRANTALEACRHALGMMAFGLLYASEKGLDEVPGVKGQTPPSPEP